MESENQPTALCFPSGPGVCLSIYQIKNWNSSTPSIQFRFHHNLDALIFVFFEGAVSRGRFVERQAMRDHKRRIDLAVLNEF
jgi:hypothetical protein